MDLFESLVIGTEPGLAPAAGDGGSLRLVIGSVAEAVERRLCLDFMVTGCREEFESQ